MNAGERHSIIEICCRMEYTCAWIGRGAVSEEKIHGGSRPWAFCRGGTRQSRTARGNAEAQKGVRGLGKQWFCCRLLTSAPPKQRYPGSSKYQVDAKRATVRQARF